MGFKKIGLFGIGTLFFFGSVHLQAATQYKIEDLGKIPDGASKTISINSNGDYTIPLENAFGGTSTYLVSNGVKQEITSQGFGDLSVTALNDSNQATGSALVDELINKRSAFLYSYGNMTNIETLDVENSQGQDINSTGVSVGSVVVKLSEFARKIKGYIHDPQSGQMVLLEDIAPTDQVVDGFITPCIYDCWELTHAFALNDSGMITGSSTAPNAADSFPTFPLMHTKLRAFVLDAQNLISLGTLGGDFSIGQAINNLGHVAGVSDLYHEQMSSPFDPIPVINLPDPSRVFLYDGKTMNDLGILEGGQSSIVEAMNSKDEVVGSVIFDGYEHAFMSLRQGLINLNSLIENNLDWTELTHATDINDNGEIVGYGQINGETHGFKLVPVEKSEMACLHVSAEICEKITSKTQ